LTAIYVKRGIDLELALRVARELMQKDALNANARGALGFPKSAWRDRYRPYGPPRRPLPSALRSGMAILLTPSLYVVPAVAASSLIYLAILGVIGANTGGTAILAAGNRVTFWGALAMTVTAGIELLIGKVVQIR